MYTTVRKLITPLLCVLFFAYQSKAQFTTCAAAAASPAGSNLTSGACLTGQNNTVSAAGANCGRGFNGSKPSLFFPFIAGSCPEFDITFNANEEVQFILWTSGCALVGGSIECSNATANVTISESYSTTSGPVLTSGTRYILQVLTRTVANYSICYTANTPEAANNECSGASGLSPIGATFNNGGNCSYSGSANDPTTSDPPASTFCAGSLENTQWITFQPTAGATSFQIIGSSIACGGPVCAWQFGIFSGSCAALTPEGCVSNGNPCTNGPDPNTFSTNPPGSTALGDACNLGAQGATFNTPGSQGVLCSGGNWGSNENTTFYSFTADATTGSLYIQNITCNDGTSGSAQFAVWTDCSSIGTYGADFLGCAVGTATLSLSPLTPGQTYYIAADGFAGNNCTWSFSGTGILLPVELGDISGIHTGREVYLEWTTLSERNNDYFTVQRTLDGKTFEDIGTVFGNGTTTESTDYAFIDVAPYSGTSYYRVKQVDYNGDFEYSELVSVSSADKDVKVLKTINLTGQEVNSNYKGLVIDILSNGTTHKRVQM